MSHFKPLNVLTGGKELTGKSSSTTFWAVPIRTMGPATTGLWNLLREHLPEKFNVNTTP